MSLFIFDYSIEENKFIMRLLVQCSQNQPVKMRKRIKNQGEAGSVEVGYAGFFA